jgi:hypothetical protein
MKISDYTMKVLQNFSSVNKNILVKQGNVLTSRSDNRVVVARAEVTEEFPVQFGIYDLPRFLATISLHKEPDFDFRDNMVVVAGEKSVLQYKYTPANMLVTPKSDRIELPTVDAEFDISGTDLQSVIKAAAVMRMPYVGLISNGSSLTLSAVALSNNGELDGDKYDVNLSDSVSEKFKMLIDVSNMRMIVQDYHVRICRKGIIEFGSPKLTYWIAPEKDSSFG